MKGAKYVLYTLNLQIMNKEQKLGGKYKKNMTWQSSEVFYLIVLMP